MFPCLNGQDVPPLDTVQGSIVFPDSTRVDVPGLVDKVKLVPLCRRTEYELGLYD